MRCELVDVPGERIKAFRRINSILNMIDRLEIRDLNAAQAMILFNIGDKELPMGELIERGYYLGSNVSYNVKKMVENGYVIQTPSPYDKRSLHVKSADKGAVEYLVDVAKEPGVHSVFSCLYLLGKSSH